MQVQGAYILPSSLYPGPVIQRALEAAVTAVVQQSCCPGGQHPWTNRRLAKGGGCGAGEYLPSSSLSNCPQEHKLWKLEPPNTSNIITIPQLSYLYPEVEPKPLKIQRLGNFREKWLGEGVQWHQHLRNLFILISKYTITSAAKGFMNAAIAISVSSSI